MRRAAAAAAATGFVLLALAPGAVAPTVACQAVFTHHLLPDGVTVDFQSEGSGQTLGTGQTVAPDSYEWDFGDGESSTQAHPNHAYDAPGTYAVELRVECGNVYREVTHEVEVPEATPCVAAFEHVVQDGLTVAFDASGSGQGDTDASSISWKFGTAGPTTVSSATTSHTFSDYGTYDVTLEVTCTGGATASATRTIVLTAPAEEPDDGGDGGGGPAPPGDDPGQDDDTQDGSSEDAAGAAGDPADGAGGDGATTSDDGAGSPSVTGRDLWIGAGAVAVVASLLVVLGVVTYRRFLD